jgi:hypothetical protein
MLTREERERLEAITRDYRACVPALADDVRWLLALIDRLATPAAGSPDEEARPADFAPDHPP